MELNKMVGTIITLSVVIISVAAIMMPVLNDATVTEATFTNEGLFRMDQYDTSADFTATWDYTDPYVLTIDGEDVALPTTSTYLMTLTGNDGFMVRAGTLSSSLGYGMQIFDSTSASAKLTISEGGEQNATITVSSGTLTFTDGTTTVSETYTDNIFFIASEGEYVMKTASSTAYVNGDSKFYGIGTTDLTVAESTVKNTPLYVEGTIDDGFTVEGIYFVDTTSEDHVINYAETDGYLDLYNLTGVSFTAVYNSYETEVTYSQIIVPYEVTAELEDHLGSGEIALINAIPAMVLVSLVITALGLSTIRNRND